MLFVPKVLVALLMLAFGAYFARFVANAVTAYCRNVHIQDAELLGRLAQYAIIAFVVLIALDQVNIGGDIVRQTFLIMLAGRGVRAGARLRSRRQGMGGGDAGTLVAAQESAETTRMPFGAEVLGGRRRALSACGRRARGQVDLVLDSRTLPMAEIGEGWYEYVEPQARPGHAVPLPHRRRAAGARPGLALPARATSTARAR